MRKVICSLLLPLIACAQEQTRTRPATVCDPDYYANILKVMPYLYVEGKPHDFFNQFDPTGVVFDSVSCRELSKDLISVTLRLRNAKGDIGVLEAGLSYVSTRVKTQAGAEEEVRRIEQSQQRNRSANQSRMQAFVGKTVVLPKKVGSFPAGIPLRMLAVSFLPDQQWQFKAFVLGHNVVESQVAAVWDKAFADAMAPGTFARLSAADRKAITAQVWEYGMSEDLLIQLWGYPDHRNNHDGEEQFVYDKGYGSSSYFYFDNHGRLVSHSSRD